MYSYIRNNLIQHSGAAFTSPPKRYKVKEEYITNTEALQQLVHVFYQCSPTSMWYCLGPSVDFILMLTVEPLLLTLLHVLLYTHVHATTLLHNNHFCHILCGPNDARRDVDVWEKLVRLLAGT